MPYILDGFKPIINVKIDGKGPFPFVVDTGGHFIVTSATARRIGLTGYGASSSVNEGRVSKVGFAFVGQLQIGGVLIRNQVAEINPYGFAKLERGPRPPKAGWLGLELFERFAVTFDPIHRRMTLRPLAFSRPVARGFRSSLVFDEDAPAACTLAEKSGLCMFDTGNAGPTIIAERWATRNGLSSYLAKGIAVDGTRFSRVPIRLGPVLRHSELVDYAPGAKSDDPSNVDAAVLAERLIDGFVATFDYARGAVWLSPTRGYMPKAFNRSGVVAQKQPDGTFVVRNIIARSPAAATGMKVHDIIIGVNGRPSFAYSRADFSEVNAGPVRTPVTYRIARGKATRNLTIRLRDILPI